MPPSDSKLRVAVFIGPTLHPEQAASLLDATYLPPIKRGDLALLPESTQIVGIVDGEFYQNFSVSTKEILVLLERGISVYGASSIGALRAVELERYGMIGVGSVFRLFRAGYLDRDDEVALSYAPDTFDAVSEPLVNTRYALRAAVRIGILRATEAGIIISNLKCLYFPDRTRTILLKIAHELIGAKRTSALRDFLATNNLDLKRLDAMRMLACLLFETRRDPYRGQLEKRPFGNVER
jgi:hypothetical protein